MQLTMLGVGSSAGTPVVGCRCDTCLSSDIRNRRTRCSSLITLDSGENILIDTGPDLRNQSLRENIQRVDAVLYVRFAKFNVNKSRYTPKKMQLITLNKNLVTCCATQAIFGKCPYCAQRLSMDLLSCLA
jgi:hypothetical protein